jgi:hypothetical protein
MLQQAQAAQALAGRLRGLLVKDGLRSVNDDVDVTLLTVQRPGWEQRKAREPKSSPSYAWAGIIFFMVEQESAGPARIGIQWSDREEDLITVVPGRTPAEALARFDEVFGQVIRVVLQP